ncbi:redoxin domain-containing protein [Persicimonas caeni]|uniref:Redoxin domain-containing protein n=1 Tax=Persicimonas caeni TaxID=2292766 RepID=A0A4Y6PPK4_PERCE|nr:redoxin domain-containing protein [Persicimonas caeni]QDG50143.1 redoxin domain-containing protein [Persicimonas caeni]QED31364.1 redoxin domain-containing protein [Persicimonas caeni]
MTMNEQNKTSTDTDAPTEKATSELTWWARMRQKRWFRWTVDLTIFALAFFAITMWQGRELVDAGAPAPEFVLTDMDGERHSLRDYRGEKTFVIFWAPWCTVCSAESDNVSRVKSWLGDRVNVISVVLDYQNRDAIQEFIDEHDVEYPVLLGNRGVKGAYNVSAYPTMYVIDDEGKIEHTAVGYTTTAGMLWRGLF